MEKNVFVLDFACDELFLRPIENSIKYFLLNLDKNSFDICNLISCYKKKF